MRRHTTQRQHSLDVVGQLPEALADCAVAPAAQQVHHHGSQEGEQGDTGAIGVAVGVLTELRIAHPVPLVLNAPVLTDQSQQAFWGGAQAGDVDAVGRRPYRQQAMSRLPLRVVVLVITSTIQEHPDQLALMCSGASLARSSQRVWRPWRFSTSVVVKAILRFPSN